MTLLICALVACAVTRAASASAAPASSPVRAVGLARSAQGCSLCGNPDILYWGAWFGDSVPWRWKPVANFAGWVHKPLSLLEFGAPWANCQRKRCFYYGFPRRIMQRVRNHGAVPMISWSSQSIPTSLHEPKFTLSQVAKGRYDGFIRKFARAAKRWRHPFFLRFDWEMNGNWFPWGEEANGNRRGSFVAAWRHVHNIFSKVGATNVSWVWCPNIDANGYWRSMTELYPGDAYVDWTCLDGYNWGTRGPNSDGAKRGGWVSFYNIYRVSYARVVQRIAPSKPMIIGEVASSKYGGSRARWIRDMLYDLPAYFPQIRGWAWVQRNYGDYGLVISRGPDTRALASGLAGNTYASNVFCKVPPALAPVLALPVVRCSTR